MKTIALIVLAFASVACGQSAQYIDKIDKPTPISNAKHEASLAKVKAAAYVPSYRFRYNYQPPTPPTPNYAALANQDRRDRSRRHH